MGKKTGILAEKKSKLAKKEGLNDEPRIPGIPKVLEVYHAKPYEGDTKLIVPKKTKRKRKRSKERPAEAMAKDPEGVEALFDEITVDTDSVPRTYGSQRVNVLPTTLTDSESAELGSEKAFVGNSLGLRRKAQGLQIGTLKRLEKGVEDLEPGIR